MQPLVERFVSLCALPSSTDVDSELTDLIQCFEGVAHGSENHSAPILLSKLSFIKNMNFDTFRLLPTLLQM